jgi:hemoglobin-like flavoprotein
MDARQVELVQQSFSEISKHSTEVAGLFYGHLFKLDPALRVLFSEDMTLQNASFMRTLSVIVWGLNRSQKYRPVVEALSESHKAYGVQSDHYQTVQTALLEALKQHLGDKFTPEIEEAWAEVYQNIAQAMQDAFEDR